MSILSKFSFAVRSLLKRTFLSYFTILPSWSLEFYSVFMMTKMNLKKKYNI